MKTCLEIDMIENITGSRLSKKNIVLPNPIKQSIIKYQLIVPFRLIIGLIFPLFTKLR